ncbi:TetR family transcriptional regulator [Nocardia neocaledoniensis NBRC 108232]|uniref:TetR family transcriptional regulator n=2 Tax=Nocardia neocaledoniensis TaxID=236511 RepID=A0A317N7R2_9NOCA|nr:TetR family transcriptional regulator [Nocardia neocaledoniensis]GEM30316.1 TetR family transcriptional regulator [Nocardia neocaledoniensis NBRC 108232]
MRPYVAASHTIELMSTTASAAGARTTRRINGLDPGERRAQREAQVLDAALELFTSRGYLATSVEQICQSSAVSTKSFYQLYANREECFLALYLRSADEIHNAVLARLDELGPREDDREIAQQLFIALVDAIAASPARAQLTLGLSNSISLAVDDARRRNRRRSSELIESIWSHLRLQGPLHLLAVGLVGAIFEIIADRAPDHRIDGAIRDELVADLTRYYEIVRAPLHQ